MCVCVYECVCVWGGGGGGGGIACMSIIITHKRVFQSNCHSSLTSNSFGSKRCLKTIILSFFILIGPAARLSLQSSSLRKNTACVCVCV